VWAPRFRERDGDPEHEAADPVRTVNDNSLVIELRFAGRSIVFAGDIEAEGEAAVVAAGLGAADIVKVAHHGSPTSSSPGFVAATHPSYAVISCGVANTFGFPSPRVVTAWQAIGAQVDRTDTGGAITATVTADGSLAVDQFQSPAP
jgi:competence protein ComEC